MLLKEGCWAAQGESGKSHERGEGTACHLKQGSLQDAPCTSTWEQKGTLMSCLAAVPRRRRSPEHSTLRRRLQQSANNRNACINNHHPWPRHTTLAWQFHPQCPDHTTRRQWSKLVQGFGVSKASSQQISMQGHCGIVIILLYGSLLGHLSLWTSGPNPKKPQS